MPVRLAPSPASLVDWIYRNGEVISREDHDDGGVALVVNMTSAAKDEMDGRLKGRPD